MKNIIQFLVKKGEDGYYVASAHDYRIVTQGKTFDSLVENIYEATKLSFKEVTHKELKLGSNPTILINYEIPNIIVGTESGIIQ